MDAPLARSELLAVFSKRDDHAATKSGAFAGAWVTLESHAPAASQEGERFCRMLSCFGLWFVLFCAMVKKKKSGAQNSAKRKVAVVKKRLQGGKGVPFQAGNEWRFPAGKSGNPGGRPKGLSMAYRVWLDMVDEESGLSNAQLLAMQMGGMALKGDVHAARELRVATEGEAGEEEVMIVLDV